MASSCMAQAHHTGKNPKLRGKPVLHWTQGEAGETNQGGSNNHRGIKTGSETRHKKKTKPTSIQNKTGNHKNKIKSLTPTRALNGFNLSSLPSMLYIREYWFYKTVKHSQLCYFDFLYFTKIIFVFFLPVKSCFVIRIFKKLIWLKT